jgi:hypothetical protein
MKRITVTALFILAAFVAGTGAMAQGHAVQATVPFDFTVGDKLLPAGTYEIWSPSTDTIEVQNRDKHVAMLTTTTYDSHESRNGGELVFDRIGEQYFLSEILCRSAAMNVSVHPFKAEQRARTQQAALHNASQVYIAAK